MSTLQSRIQFNIAARDQTAPAFRSVDAQLKNLEKTFKAIGKVATFGILGNEVQRFLSWVVEVNREVPAVAASLDAAGLAADRFARAIGDGGLNESLININATLVALSRQGDGGAEGFFGKLLGAGLDIVDFELKRLDTTVYAVGRGLEIVKNGFSDPASLVAMETYAGAVQDVADRMAGVSAEAQRQAALFSTPLTESGPGKTDREIRRAASAPRVRSFAPVVPLRPERDPALAQIEAYQDHMRDLRQQGEMLTESLLGPQERYQASMRRIDTLLKAGVITHETYNLALQEAARDATSAAEALNSFEAAADPLRDTFASLSDSLKTGLGETLMQIVTRADSVSEAFDNMFSSIAQQLGSQVMNRGISQLVDLLMGSTSHPLYGAGGSGLMSLFDGFFAGGGKIGSGRWGIAGEAGPEIITGPATVTPMGGDGGLTVVINNAPPGTRARQVSDGRGGRRLEVDVAEMVAAEMSRTGTPAHRALMNPRPLVNRG